MATLREIRRRIGGVKNTQKITKAMKMVAAAKLRRAQDAVVAARPYARTMRQLLGHLAGVVDVSANPLFAVRPIGSVAIVVVTADRGLCGAFNSNILRAAASRIRQQYDELNRGGNVRLICVGRKGADFLAKGSHRIDHRHVGLFAALQFADAQAIAAEATSGFLEGRYDRVEVVYNEFKSIVQQRVTVEQLLPIVPEHLEGADKRRRTMIHYIYEPSSDAIVTALVPKHINFQVWRMLLESSAAEHGARMTAMDNATTNASELIRDLQLSYNKARQASITKELLEIVSGAEALRQAG